MTQEEYGRFYLQGFTRTVRVLRARGASVELAEDVAQTAWMQGWRRLDQLRDSSAMTGWINTIAINFHRRAGRHEARYQPLPLEVSGACGVDSAPFDIAKILGNCSPRERSLLEQQLNGLSMDEIAQQQGITTTAIRLKLFRARRHARAKLSKATASSAKAFSGCSVAA